MSGPGVRRHRSPGDAAPAASPTRRSSSFASLSVSNRHPRLVVKLELHRRGDEARASSPARCREAPWHQVPCIVFFASLRLCAFARALFLYLCAMSSSWLPMREIASCVPLREICAAVPGVTQKKNLFAQRRRGAKRSREKRGFTRRHGGTETRPDAGSGLVCDRNGVVCRRSRCV